MKKAFTVIFTLFAAVSLITLTLTYFQVSNEQVYLENDLNYRSALLAEGLRDSVEPNFINKSDLYLQGLVERYSDRKRIAGLAVVDSNSKQIAVSSSLTNEMSQLEKFTADVMDADKAQGKFETFNNEKIYVYAVPLHDNESVVGALMVVQKASYVNDQLIGIWRDTIVRLFIQILLICLTVLLILRWVIYVPAQKLVESLRMARIKKGELSSLLISRNPFFRPILQEVSEMQQSLLQAQLAASEEARASLEKLDSPWTEERLKQFVKDILKNRTIVTVSLKEPYIHEKKNNSGISFYSPATGVVTAIEPIMQACGGTWIAYGSGSGDRLVVDDKDKIQVPPTDPKYSLKRIWLTEEENKGFSQGFCSEGIWPLCNVAHVRPTFRENDWEQYKKVNHKFAKSVLKELKKVKRPVIFIQDFQFTLLPRILKEARPDATIGLFWHIPWPNPESFGICPWKKEILEGMLGADLIGFHTQLHANNFINTVGRELEALIDLERFTVTKDSHETLVKPFPISIAFTGGDHTASDIKNQGLNRIALLKKYGITSKYVGIGIERLDYIKGLLERLKALELFFERYPEYRGKVTFIQIAVSSATLIKSYKDYEARVDEEVKNINDRFKTKNWKPIVAVKELQNHADVTKLYQAANFCMVTSLHDGMNLVAKEYVAARNDEKGVLILSQFAGASKELRESLIINPYNPKQTAEAIYAAVNMPESEQRRRMRVMRQIIKANNIYRWAADFLKTMAGIK